MGETRAQWYNSNSVSYSNSVKIRISPLLFPLLVDYHRIVKRPMDVKTVRARIERRDYQSKHECAEDIRIIWSNAMLYNGLGSKVYSAAKNVRQLHLLTVLLYFPTNQPFVILFFCQSSAVSSLKICTISQAARILLLPKETSCQAARNSRPSSTVVCGSPRRIWAKCWFCWIDLVLAVSPKGWTKSSLMWTLSPDHPLLRPISFCRKY
jgi:hypothetical protein